MIDIVIPLRNDSKWDNNEIRYCLRSVEKHLTDIRDVYIIGHKPKFLQNVKHIEMRDTSQWATVNIRKKLLAACDNPEVSPNFLYMNDDHYLLESYKKDHFYYCGTLDEALQSSKHSIYTQIIRNTIYRLGGYAPYYDVHTPVLINKEVFTESMNQDPGESAWPLNPNEWHFCWGGYLIKSTYCNYLFSKYKPVFDTTKVEDGKVRHYMSYPQLKEFIMSRPVLSSTDDVLIDMRLLLQELYPEKSKYEI